MLGLQKEHQEQLQQAITDTLGYFTSNYDYSKVTLPLLKNTYTLWRNYVFKNINKLPYYSHQQDEVNFMFYLMSECKYLKQFKEQLKPPPESGLACTEPKRENVNQKQFELMTEYSKVLWEHTVYCELFYDIISIPYLQHLYPAHKRYRLKARFIELSPLSQSEASGEIMEKVSQGVLKKGFGEIVQKIFTKTFLLRASSIAIKLNPLAIGATFAFSSLLDYYRKQKRQGQLLSKLEQLIKKCNDNIEFLKGRYEECIELIGGVLKRDQATLGLFLGKMEEVIQLDWLQVKNYKSDDGWQVVVLQGDPDQSI